MNRIIKCANLGHMQMVTPIGRSTIERAMYNVYMAVAHPTCVESHKSTLITNDMPNCGGGDVSTDVAASDDDDDDGGDSDGEPARRSPLKKSPFSPSPALLGFGPLSHYVGFGRSRIYSLISQGEFPPPIKIGKSSRWVRAEIDAWLSKQIAARQHQLTAE